MRIRIETKYEFFWDEVCSVIIIYPVYELSIDWELANFPICVRWQFIHWCISLLCMLVRSINDKCSFRIHMLRLSPQQQQYQQHQRQEFESSHGCVHGVLYRHSFLFICFRKIFAIKSNKFKITGSTSNARSAQRARARCVCGVCRCVHKSPFSMLHSSIQFRRHTHTFSTCAFPW